MWPKETLFVFDLMFVVGSTESGWQDSPRGSQVVDNQVIWLFRLQTFYSRIKQTRLNPLSKTMWQPPPAHHFRHTWNMSIVHTEVSPVMDNTVCCGVLSARSSVAFLSVSHRRSTSSFSTSFQCDFLNTFTMVTYPCRCVIDTHVSSFLSYPCHRTLYTVLFTLPSRTWQWKSSPIATICLGIHWNDPSVCFENTVQTGSKYDVSVSTVSVCSPWVRFLFDVFVFLSVPPLSSVLSDAMGLELFFLARTPSGSGAGVYFYETLQPSPFALFGMGSHENPWIFVLTGWSCSVGHQPNRTPTEQGGVWWNTKP